jgi:small subunit ribosomal protein S1
VAQSQQELEKIATGSIIDVRITRLADFGAFAELLPGIEGLLHVSELSWTERVTHPSELVSVGQQLKVKVLSRDGGGARVSREFHERTRVGSGCATSHHDRR